MEYAFDMEDEVEKYLEPMYAALCAASNTAFLGKAESPDEDLAEDELVQVQYSIRMAQAKENAITYQTLLAGKGYPGYAKIPCL